MYITILGLFLAEVAYEEQEEYNSFKNSMYNEEQCKTIYAGNKISSMSMSHCINIYADTYYYIIIFQCPTKLTHKRIKK